MLSRKLFCYTTTNTDADAATGKGPTLLERLRKRPGGPVQQIPMDQAVAVYDTAVSCMTVPSNNDNKLLLLHTEWPCGNVVGSKAVLGTHPLSPTRSRNANNKQAAAIEFSVFARPQTKPLHQAEVLIPPVVVVHAAAAVDAAATTTRESTTASPARSAFIQFGASKLEATGKFGARESYHYYSNNNSGNDDDADDGDSVVRYTRYGEAPVWYGPGRMCQLELTGKRLLLSTSDSADIQQHVPVVAAIIQHHIPGFWWFGTNRRPSAWLPPDEGNTFGLRRACHTDDIIEDPVFSYYAQALHTSLQTDVEGSAAAAAAVVSHDNSMSCADYRRYYADLAVGRAVDRFRAQRPLELWNDRSNNYSRLQRWHGKAQSCWDRVRAATSISIGASGDDER